MGEEEANDDDSLLGEKLGRVEVDPDGNMPVAEDLCGGATDDVGSRENLRVKLMVFLGRFKDVVNVAMEDGDDSGVVVGVVGVVGVAGRHISQAMEP